MPRVGAATWSAAAAVARASAGRSPATTRSARPSRSRRRARPRAAAAGSTSTTSWPSAPAGAQASSHAARHSGSTSASAIDRLGEPGDPQPAGLAVARREEGLARRPRRPVGSPGCRPAMTSSSAAASRDGAGQRAADGQAEPGSPYAAGRPVIRPRDGFSPTRPQRWPGSGSSRRRRCPARAAPDRRPPPRPLPAGPAGAAREVPRRPRRRADPRSRCSRAAELRGARLAQADGPGRPHPRGPRGRRPARTKPAYDRAAVADRHPGDVVQVLDRHGHAGQRRGQLAVRRPTLLLPGLGERELARSP